MYLGCQVHLIPKLEGTTGRLAAVKTNGIVEIATPSMFNPKFEVISIYQIHEVKPILRKLSSITEEEQFFCAKEMYCSGDEQPDARLLQQAKVAIMDGFGGPNLASWRIGFLITQYLLSRTFDLFRLCDAGLAIDSSKS